MTETYIIPTLRHTHNQPGVRPFDYGPNSSMPDLRGMKFGQFTVIGLAAEYNEKKGPRWVVKCSCGIYEQRTTRAIRNRFNDKDCCDECKYGKFVND